MEQATEAQKECQQQNRAADTLKRVAKAKEAKSIALKKVSRKSSITLLILVCNSIQTGPRCVVALTANEKRTRIGCNAVGNNA